MSLGDLERPSQDFLLKSNLPAADHIAIGIPSNTVDTSMHLHSGSNRCGLLACDRHSFVREFPPSASRRLCPQAAQTLAIRCHTDVKSPRPIDTLCVRPLRDCPAARCSHRRKNALLERAQLTCCCIAERRGHCEQQELSISSGPGVFVESTTRGADDTCASCSS